jgi:acyl-coenzyme A thioesterase PaaI-like protein
MSKKSLETVLNFIKLGNSQPASKPGFGHALTLSYNLIDKERLTLSANRKVLSYRYRLNDQVPKATTGLFTALMDELSTHACFGAGMPSPPGVSLQMQTELLKPIDNAREFDIINTVTKLGRTVSHTRTDFVCTTTLQPLAFSSHVKYMPTGSRLTDWVLTKPWLYNLYESWAIKRKGDPPTFDENHVFKDVIAGHMEPTSVGQARFHMTQAHTNPLGAMHGGCHAMVMEHVARTFAKAELYASSVTLEAMQIEFLAAAKGTVDVVCETVAILEPCQKMHVRVKIQQGDRILSEGKLRFAAGATAPA